MTIDPTIIAVGGAIGGFALNILLKIGHGYIEEVFKDRARNKAIKRKFADQLMDICVEGSTVGWNVMPGSQRHIQRVAAEIEATDNEVCKKLQHYLAMWCLCAIPQTPPYNKADPKIEDIETATKWQHEAQIVGEELLVVARGWSK